MLGYTKENTGLWQLPNVPSAFKDTPTMKMAHRVPLGGSEGEIPLISTPSGHSPARLSR